MLRSNFGRPALMWHAGAPLSWSAQAFLRPSLLRAQGFAERLKDVARVYARGTDHQREALEWIAFALGGKADARLARQLGLYVSPDTLLNRIREALCADDESVRVLGVDDFGMGRDNAPCTILMDLERHKIVDLLGEHSVGSLAKWLSQHPKVEVASRDRSHVCWEGLSAGGPQATKLQVADRAHAIIRAREAGLGREDT